MTKNRKKQTKRAEQAKVTASGGHRGGREDILARRRAFRRFRSGRTDRLAHFDCHDAAQSAFSPLQNIGSGGKPLRPFREWCVPIRAPCGIGAGERGVHLCA